MVNAAKIVVYNTAICSNAKKETFVFFFLARSSSQRLFSMLLHNSAFNLLKLLVTEGQIFI